MWDARYSGAEYVYGTAPNDFLASVADQIPKGWVLSLAEGEGRNAVYLAGLGYKVLAVDSSAVGLGKAQQLAKEYDVAIETRVADLADFAIEAGGPPTADMLMTLDLLRTELAGLRFIHAREMERDVIEGKFHTGRGAVVQVVAVKP